MSYKGPVYEVWHGPSNNLAGAFTTQDEALALLRDEIALHGPDHGEAFVLGREYRGRFRVIAEGDDLVRLALANQPAGAAAP